MPKLFHTLLFSVVIFSFFARSPQTVLAAPTDPQSATVSATASVATITPTTSDTTAPSNPILIRPTDATITSDNTPEFVWRGSTDPNGNYVVYNLYINGVATYLGISNIGNSAGNNYNASIDGSEIRLTPTVAFADGSYTWYVTASDGSGNASFSTTWGFIVDTSAPPLTLVDLESFHNPTIVEGSNFDIDGPKNINFTILSDPFVSIQIAITSDADSFELAGTTASSGRVYLDQFLEVGVYIVSILAIDRAGNTTFLPDFALTINQSEFTVSIPTTPGAPNRPIISIPYTPINLSSLPATIANIQTRLPLLIGILSLLAVLVLLLLIVLWARRRNLILIDPAGQPIRRATIYHSHPRKNSKTSMIVTKNDPIIYELRKDDLGKLYIPHLSRFSTLTIRVEAVTYILSISADSKIHTIVLG